MSDTITPFECQVPDAVLADLKDRLARTIWPDQLDGAGWDYGTERDFLQQLCTYWRDEFDWRASEARFNRYPQFKTEIEGETVHFYHIRSPEPGAVPLIITHGYPGSVAEFGLLPGVVEACAELKAAGFLLVVATNQPDVGRGTQRREEVEAMHAAMCAALPVDRVEVCYDPGQGQPSEFRKPAPGMLLRAARELGIDLAQSWMIGDRWRDIDCGAAAGCRTIFIDHGYDEPLRAAPDFRAASLRAAVPFLLGVGG